MNKEALAEFLAEFGLKPQEAKLYLACLRLGQDNVSRISEAAGVQRTFAYEILEKLSDQGLVSSVDFRGVKQYSAVSIEKFRALQREKLRRLDEIMPELKALEKAVGDRPRVQLLEGREGVMAAFEDTLTASKGSELLAYSTGEGWHERETKFMQEYVKRRVARQIKARAIMTDTEGLRPYVPRDKEELRETRVVRPEEYPFTNEINIYGNKVAIMSLVGELIAVIIESESIAKTQRAIFELAWRGVGK